MKNKVVSAVFLPAMLLVFQSTIPIQSVHAADEIRVLRANQYHQLKKRLNRKQNSRPGYHHYSNQLYRSRSNSRPLVVPDSRFPNSYLELSYQQRQQAQSWRQR